MKIILLKEVSGLGHKGEVKEVKEGYARNFLIPKGMADVVTKHSLNVLAAQKRKREKSKKLSPLKRDHAKAGEVRSKKLLAGKFNNKSFEILAKADEKGTLYAKLDAKNIASELAKQGYKMEVSEVKLEKPIKKIGEYKIELRLADKKAIIKLKVENK